MVSSARTTKNYDPYQVFPDPYPSKVEEYSTSQLERLGRVFEERLAAHEKLRELLPTKVDYRSIRKILREMPVNEFLFIPVLSPDLLQLPESLAELLRESTYGEILDEIERRKAMTREGMIWAGKQAQRTALCHLFWLESFVLGGMMREKTIRQVVGRESDYPHFRG